MKADTSFSQKLKTGWTKEQLLAYYALTEREYERIMECLKGIDQAGCESLIKAMDIQRRALDIP